MDHNIHPSMGCELSIIRANNIYVKPKGSVFVRCYLHAGSKGRVRLDSQEIPSNSDSIAWNQTFSLDCSGDEESMERLHQGNLVFELRWRSTSAPFIGRIKSSRLIGRAEVPWRNIANTEIRKWIVMTPENGRVYDDIINQTTLQVALKLQESRKRVSKEIRWDEGCGCISCIDYEFFAIEAVVEA